MRLVLAPRQHRERPVPAPRQQRERPYRTSIPASKHTVAELRKVLPKAALLPKDFPKKAPFQYSWYLLLTVKFEITLHGKTTECSVNLTQREKERSVRRSIAKEVQAGNETVCMLFTETAKRDWIKNCDSVEQLVCLVLEQSVAAVEPHK